MNTQYTPPVSLLLSCDPLLPDEKLINGWPDYLTLRFTHEHVAQLIQMATDDTLLRSKDDGEFWAPIHAWRTLGQLRAANAVVPFLRQLHKIDDEDDDWIAEEFPEVFAQIGAPAIPLLAHYIAQPAHGLFAKNAAALGLRKIGVLHPQECNQCIEALEQQLRQFAQNDPTFNGFLVGYLLDLKAVDAVESMRQAFSQDAVDLRIVGDVEEAEIALGIREKRSTPRETWTKKVFPNRVFEGEAGIPPNFYGIRGQPLLRSTPKIGRNDPCPCGSGKKFKKCCLHIDTCDNAHERTQK